MTRSANRGDGRFDEIEPTTVASPVGRRARERTVSGVAPKEVGQPRPPTEPPSGALDADETTMPCDAVLAPRRPSSFPPWLDEHTPRRAAPPSVPPESELPQSDPPRSDDAMAPGEATARGALPSVPPHSDPPQSDDAMAPGEATARGALPSVPPQSDPPRSDAPSPWERDQAAVPREALPSSLAPPPPAAAPRTLPRPAPTPRYQRTRTIVAVAVALLGALTALSIGLTTC